jgi:hypothetical protein
LTITIRGSSVAEENADLVDALGYEREEVPEHVGIFQVGLRVAFLGVDEIREFARVTDEEDWSVVAGHVPVAFLGVELHCESSRVTFSIS